MCMKLPPALVSSKGISPHTPANFSLASNLEPRRHWLGKPARWSMGVWAPRPRRAGRAAAGARIPTNRATLRAARFGFGLSAVRNARISDYY